MRAELKWLRGVVADLRSRQLKFPTLEEIMRISAHQGGPSEEAIRSFTSDLEKSPAKRRRPAKRARR